MYLMRISNLFSTLTLCFLFLFPQTVNAHNRFDLETLYQQALLRNRQYQSAKIEFEIKRLQLIQTEFEHERQGAIIALRRAESSFLTAERELEMIAKDLRLMVESQYYSYLNLLEQIAIVEKEIALLTEEVQIAEASFREGKLTQYDLDLLRQELGVLEFQLQSLNRKVESAKIQILVVVGVPLNTEFELESAFGQIKLQPIEIEFEIATIIRLLEENNVELLRLQDELQIAELEQSVADFSSPVIKEIKFLQNQVFQLQYQKTLDELVLHTLEIIEHLRSLEEQYVLTKRRIKSAEEHKRLLEAKWREGLIIHTAVLRAELDLKKLNFELRQIANEYRLAILTLCKFGLL